MAAFQVLLENDYIAHVKKKENFLLHALQHPAIINKRSSGLWASLQFDSFDNNLKAIRRCIANGLISDWFLFAADRMRIAPPLSITDEELERGCNIIVESIQAVFGY